MPIRHGDILAKRASTWLRDHFCRNTIAPRRSRPTMWKQFLPISMPTTAISLLNFNDMAVLLGFAAPRQPSMLAGSEHGRTIPLADVLTRDQRPTRLPPVLGSSSREIIHLRPTAFPFEGELICCEKRRELWRKPTVTLQ